MFFLNLSVFEVLFNIFNNSVINFSTFQHSGLSFPLLKMLKTFGEKGFESRLGCGKPKSYPQRFPQFPPQNVENSEKQETVRFAQISHLIPIKRQLKDGEKWIFCPEC